MTERPEPKLVAAPEPLPVAVTDAHTHLGTTERKTGLTAADSLARAASVGVTRLVDVGYDVPSSRSVIEVAHAHDEVIAVVAMHPSDVVETANERGRDALDEALRELEAMVADERVRGVGETGLDYYWVSDAEGQALQREVFAAHIAWAKASGKALVIHDRDAHDDVLAVLDAEGWPERVQMHCFSGDADFARRCLDAGATLSFAGTVTFKANEYLRDALRLAPLDRVVVETDAPYLTPVPARGKPNASYLIPHTARFCADVRGDDLETFCTAVDANASALFGGWGGRG